MDCNILSNPSVWTFPALQSKMKIRNVPSWMLPHDQGEGINKETGRQAWSIGPDLVFVFYPDNILSRRKFLSHKLHNGCNLDSLLLESLWDGTPREGVQKKSEEEKIDKYLSALSRYCSSRNFIRRNCIFWPWIKFWH